MNSTAASKNIDKTVNAAGEPRMNKKKKQFKRICKYNFL